MADKAEKRDAVKDLGWFILIMLAFFLLWFFSKGGQQATEKLVNVKVTSSNGQDQNTGSSINTALQNPSSHQQISSSNTSNDSQKVTPPSSTNTNLVPPPKPAVNPYSDITSHNRTPGTSNIQNKSPFFNQVVLEYTGSVHTSNPDNEYLVLETSSHNPYSIDITGWTIVSTSTGSSATIGMGDELPFSTSIGINNESPIYLKPGYKADLISGQSPINGSFGINECSGFLNQFYSFNPYVRSSCPILYDQPFLPTPPNALDDACLDYIEYYPSCQTPNINSGHQYSLPTKLSYQCQQFIIDHQSYGQCVLDHKTDTNFYSKEWRIYLGRTQSLWKSERETIELLDSNGLLVDKISY